MRRRARIALAASGLAILVTVASQGRAAAQRRTSGRDTVTLDHVENLVEAGRTGDARTALLDWWSHSLPKASRRDVQRGLWLRARLTVDPSQAELDYTRLVVEYPGGPYSAQALLRLAQAAWASGDSAEAVRNVTRLSREYPGSRIDGEARAWLAGAGPLPRPPPAPPRDSTPARAAHPAKGGRYAIQLGAFASEARARNVQRRAKAAGFDSRLIRVPGNRLIRVRVGRLGSVSAAREMSARLHKLGFKTAIVSDANQEEPIHR